MIGRYRVIGSAREAATLLLGRWPGNCGDAYSTALRCCTDVLNGLALATDAREAFIEAAREARVLISVTDEYRL